MNNQELLEAKAKELEQIKRDLMTICEQDLLMVSDLEFFAQRVSDIKQEIRIIRARMI